MVGTRVSRARSSTTSMTSMVSLSHFEEAGVAVDPAKLDTILEELDIEVESRCRLLLSQSQHLARQIRNTLQVELVKLPKKIRQMPLEEFMTEYSGDINAVLLEDVKKLGEIVKTPKSVKKHKKFFQQPQGTPLRQAFKNTFADEKEIRAKKTYNRKTTILVAQEDNDWLDATNDSSSNKAAMMPPRPSTSKRPRTTKATPTQPKRRVTRASFRAGASMVPQTPANSGTRSVWDTPLQTPAFDPRLPFTPRVAREGEMLLSQNGSPLELQNAPGTVVKAGRNRNTVMIDLGGDEVNIASPSVVQNLTGQDKEHAVERLQAIQDQVALLMSQLND